MMKTKTAQSQFAASGGWAALAKWVDRELREARQMAEVYAKKGNAWNESHFYGQVAALDNVRATLARRMKAQPNARMSDRPNNEETL